VTLPLGTTCALADQSVPRRDSRMAPRTRDAVRLTLVVLCLVGAWISGELVKQHAGP
jgi:hypothetical protein